MVGLLLAGWGAFNLVEGVVDHHVLTIHDVRNDVEEPLAWDLGFLALEVLLVVVGMALRASDRGRSAQVVDVRGRATTNAERRSTATKVTERE